MPVEAVMLTWTVVLAVVQLIVAILATMTQVPFATLMGNRDDMPAVTGWAGRAKRAYANLMETLPLFAACVLLVLATGRTSHVTAFASALFLGARVAYAVVYIAGVPWLRTLCWAAALIALLHFPLVLLR